MRRPEMIDIAFDAGGPLDRGSNVPLAAEPRDQALRQFRPLFEQGPSIRTQHRGKSGCRPRDAGKPLLHQPRGRFDQRRAVFGGEATLPQHLLLERKEPAIDDAAKRALVTVGSGQTLCQAAIYGLHAMERCLSLGYLHLAGGKATTARALLKPPAEEGLATAVFAAYGFEQTAAQRHRLQISVEGRLKALDADGKSCKALAWDGTAPERIDGLGATLWAEHSDLSELELPLQQRPFQRNRLRDTVEMQNASGGASHQPVGAVLADSTTSGATTSCGVAPPW